MDHENQNMPVGGDTRREFIKKASTAAAAAAAVNILKTPVYGQAQAPSANVIGANSKIVVGHIGVGGQGTAHVNSVKNYASANNVAQAAVCDVWTARAEKAKAIIGGNVDIFQDYRKVLDRKDIDAVVIATVDHWHTPISIEAMHAGKHVYVEKPMTRYLQEAFDIETAVKKTGKILQVGSQGCSDAKWHKAAELIRAGKIGQLVLGQGSYMRNSPKGEWNYNIDRSATPETLDWKRWLGQTGDRPFDLDHYFRWRKYYPYCAGLLGDLFPHRLHPLMLATGKPEFPTRVVAIGTKKVLSDKNTPGTYMRDVPENIQVLAEFPSGLTLFVTSSTINEQGLPDMIRGHHGTLTFGGNRVQLDPERPFAEEVEPERYEKLSPGEDLPPHEKDWFDSIRANRQPHAGIDLAVRVQTVISLAEISDRLKVACLFDEKTRKITTGDGREVTPLHYGDRYSQIKYNQKVG